MLRKCAVLLEERNDPYCGLIAPGKFRAGKRDTFDLLILPEKTSYPLASRKQVMGWFFWNSWWFDPRVFEEGTRLIREAVLKGTPILLDEVGKLELDSLGWAAAMDTLHHAYNPAIITCRSSFAEQVARRWPASWLIKELKNTDPSELAEFLTEDPGR